MCNSPCCTEQMLNTLVTSFLWVLLVRQTASPPSSAGICALWVVNDTCFLFWQKQALTLARTCRWVSSLVSSSQIFLGKVSLCNACVWRAWGRVWFSVLASPKAGPHAVLSLSLSYNWCIRRKELVLTISYHKYGQVHRAGVAAWSWSQSKDTSSASGPECRNGQTTSTQPVVSGVNHL